MDPDDSPSHVHCGHCGELHPASFSHCPKTGRPLNAGRALVGRVIADRYRVLGLLGEGGMGAVYVAEHLMIGRKVALKRLHPELAGDERAVQRFQREARAAAATGHEHIVEVLDLGFSEDGAPFLVMEYLRGKNLAQVLRESGPLDPSRACRIVGQVLAALGAVHEQGIIHRDLKPDNIILTPRRGDPDFVKVVDFGISKMQRDDELALTRTGVMLGTPFYMSPEQARGRKDLDHRVDLYAVGVMLYECLAGRLPFDGDNYHQLLQAILSGRRPAVSALRPTLPEGLASVVERAIALERDARYPSARELLLALVPHGAVDPSTEHRSAVGHDRRGRDRAESGVLERDPGDLGPDAESPPPPAVVHDAPTAEWTPRSRAPERADANAPTMAWARSSSSPRAKGLAPDSRPAPVGPPLRGPADGHAARPSTPSPSKGEPTRIKGSIVLSALDVLERHEGTLARVLEHLDRLDPTASEPLRRVILPMAWLPLTVYVQLLRAAERELGETAGALAVRIGRATADRELTTTHRLFMQGATPATAVERIPQMFRTYHAPGRVEVERTTAGSYRIETRELVPDALLHAIAMSGFYGCLLERAGAHDVRVQVHTSRERGEATTVTTLRWR